jgi:hypothetical protein
MPRQTQEKTIVGLGADIVTGIDLDRQSGRFCGRYRQTQEKTIVGLGAGIVAGIDRDRQSGRFRGRF